MRLKAAIGLGLAAIAAPVAMISAVSAAQAAAAVADQRLAEFTDRVIQWLHVDPDPARQPGQHP